MLNNLLQMHLKLFQKEQFKKQMATGLAIKLLIKIRVSKISPRNNSVTNEEEIEKDIYLQKKDRKLLIINKIINND